MERCCCGFFDVQAGARRLTCLSTVGFTVASVVYIVLATEFDSSSVGTKETLLRYFQDSFSAAVANASVTTTGAVVSILSCWGVHRKRRRWIVPFLVFWVLFMFLQVAYIVLISVIYGQEMAMRDFDNPSERQEMTTDFAICVAWRTAFVLIEVYFLFVVYSYYAKQGHVDGSCGDPVPKGSLGFGTARATWV